MTRRTSLLALLALGAILAWALWPAPKNTHHIQRPHVAPLTPIATATPPAAVPAEVTIAAPRPPSTPAPDNLTAPADIAPERRTMGLPIFVEGHQLHPDDAPPAAP